jgi:hypothetical protein
MLISKTSAFVIASIFMSAGAVGFIEPKPVVAEDQRVNILTVDGMDISDYVASHIENKEFEVRILENGLLDQKDIRDIEVPEVLENIGIPKDTISEKVNNTYDLAYTIDIPGTNWILDYNLSSEFGCSTPKPAEYVLSHINENGQRSGFIQVNTGSDICFSTCEDMRKIEFDHVPFAQDIQNYPKVILTNGEHSANSYEIALAATLVDAIYHEGEARVPATTEPTTSNDDPTQIPENVALKEKYENFVKNLDLTTIPKAIEARLDNRQDIRDISIAELISVSDYRLSCYAEGDKDIFSVKDGLSTVEISYQDIGMYDRTKPILTYRGRNAGSTYKAEINSYLNVTEKEMSIDIHTDVTQNVTAKIPDYSCNNYYLLTPSGHSISAETLSIVQALLNNGD